jgi:SSS family solute:Na+ symporter
MQLPPILAGLVLAAALAAVMSTSSGALIATATVFSQDIVARLRKRDIEAGSEDDHLRSNRIYGACFGVLMILIACILQDVVAALTVAYDILCGRTARADTRRTALAARHERRRGGGHGRRHGRDPRDDGRRR